TNRGRGSVTPKEITLLSSAGFEMAPDSAPLAELAMGGSASRRFTVRVADDAPLSSRPYFGRAGIQESRYTLSDPREVHRPAPQPPLVAVARYTVEGVSAEVRRVVVRLEAHLPYGQEGPA